MEAGVQMLTKWQSVDVDTSGGHVCTDEKPDFVLLELFQVLCSLVGRSVRMQANAF